MAGPTGLEPATSAVTGRRSSQLSYDPEQELLKKASELYGKKIFRQIF